MPSRLTISLARSISEWRFGTTVSVAADNRLSYSTTPVVAAGVEHDLLPFLPLRAGAAIGGAGGPALGWGGGLRVARVELNLGFRIDRGVWLGNGRGLTAAMALDISL